MPHNLKTKTIGKDAFAQLSSGARRVRFADNFPRPFLTPASPDSRHGWCESPFLETIAPLFTAGTGLEFKPHAHRYRCEFRDEREFERVADWVKAQRGRLFLRSLLPCCVALDLNFRAEQPSPPTERTKIGQWEHDAKWHGNERAIFALAREIAAAVGEMPHYRDARFIAAVPPLRRKPFHLPSRLAGDAAKMRKMFDLTRNFQISGAPAPELKGLRLAEKWDKLDRAKLTLRAENLPRGGENVILLDDKYQSGVTMHHVAMRMQEAGVSGPILGLAVVKTWHDDDNRR